jgi:chromosomal replication initiation ATPase DnaA
MRGINMSKSELWKKFLENIKEVISSTSFDIWFNENDTKLYSLKNDIATITVNQEVYKKHLEEHYIDNMNEAMRKTTGNDVTINIVLEKDIASLEEERKKQKNELSTGFC